MDLNLIDEKFKIRQSKALLVLKDFMSSDNCELYDFSPYWINIPNYALFDVYTKNDGTKIDFTSTCYHYAVKDNGRVVTGQKDELLLELKVIFQKLELIEKYTLYPIITIVKIAFCLLGDDRLVSIEQEHKPTIIKQTDGLMLTFYTEKTGMCKQGYNKYILHIKNDYSIKLNILKL